MSNDNNEGQEINPVLPGSNGEVTGAPSSQSNGGQAKAVSPQKLAANRANGKKSPGPTTPEGKERSKRNSFKHGFFARQPLPAGKEGDMLWEKYHDLVLGIWNYYQPMGYIEGLLTEKIATESIRFSRLLSYESTFRGVGVFGVQGVDRLLRYQSAINRQLFQAMKELERLQDKRKYKIALLNGSGQEPDEQTAGAVTPSEGQNHGPQGLLAAVETPPIEMDEPPGSSQVLPLPASTQSVTDGQQPTSQPFRQVSNYETNPTGAQPGEPGAETASRPSQGNSLAESAQPVSDGQQQASQRLPQAADYGTNPTGAPSREPDDGTAARSILDRKTSLTDLVSKSASIPPAGAPDDLAALKREQAERPEHVNDEFESPVAPKELIESPEDEATWNAVQKTIRKGNPEDLP